MLFGTSTKIPQAYTFIIEIIIDFKKNSAFVIYIVWTRSKDLTVNM